jgi:dolichol-phosphate mannosyltransferase
MKIFLLLPAYNEAKALPSLLRAIPEKLKGLNYEVIVVDDGSSDQTVAMIKSLPITLLLHDENKGLGAALNTGLTYILKHGQANDLVVTMDADDTHDPALISKMLLGDDIVIASRYCPNGRQTGVGAIRAFLSRLVSFGLKIIWPIKGATDYSSGYRAYQWSVLSRAQKIFGAELIENRGFTCMPELLMKLAAIGATVSEVPLIMHYEVKQSESKYNALALLRGYLSLCFGVSKTLRRYKI